MNLRMNLRTIVFAAVAAVSLSHISSAIAEDMVVLPEAKTQNGITYLSGGIGSDQVTAMKEAARDYTLMLTCAVQNTGEYLSDVKVRITDKSGTTVLETVTDGPILLAKLKPGQYRINADNNGAMVNNTVRISDNHPVKLNMHWPEQHVSEQ